MSLKRRIGEFLYKVADSLAPKDVIEPTIQYLICKILDRPIRWIDWKSLGKEDKLAWGREAKSVLENRAFKSLCGYKKQDGTKINGELVKVIMESGFRHSGDYQSLRDARMIICGIERIWEELESMLYEEEKETNENLNAVI